MFMQRATALLSARASVRSRLAPSGFPEMRAGTLLCVLARLGIGLACGRYRISGDRARHQLAPFVPRPCGSGLPRRSTVAETRNARTAGFRFHSRFLQRLQEVEQPSTHYAAVAGALPALPQRREPLGIAIVWVCRLMYRTHIYLTFLFGRQNGASSDCSKDEAVVDQGVGHRQALTAAHGAGEKETPPTDGEVADPSFGSARV